MKLQDINFIDSTVCKNYLLQEFGHRDYNTLSKHEKDRVKVFTTLIEFIETGTILPSKEITNFNCSIGRIMIDYITFKTSQRLAKHTILEYEQQLYRFLRYLNENMVVSIDSINQLHILNYIKQINPQKKSLARMAIRVLRDFFKYLYNQKVLNKDYSWLMPKDNYKAQAKIPSSYSKEEIEKLIATIDRGRAVGKRDYSIILLAARLGLRASDIANLKFVLFISFMEHVRNIKAEKLSLKSITKETVIAFLDWLQVERKSSDTTRNIRLAALHSFFRYVQYQNPDNLYEYQNIMSIRSMKTKNTVMNYLSVEGIKLLLDQPDVNTQKGRRDLSLLSLLYDTGSRVQEIIDLNPSVIRLDKPSTIQITGKGNKTRIVPLLEQQVVILKNYLHEHGLLKPQARQYPLFSNSHQEKLTRPGVTHILLKYANKAREKDPYEQNYRLKE